MDALNLYGFYLFQKSSQDNKVLKDLLQYIRSTAPGKNHTFSYVEAENSLHPHLSLMENLQLEVGFKNWKEFQMGTRSEWTALMNLIKRPELEAGKAENWERFLISYLKGAINPTKNLLIDMNEDLYSAFHLQSFKKNILQITKEKSVFIATANSPIWLDCAHTLIGRREYQFEVQTLDSELVKKHWAA